MAAYAGCLQPIVRQASSGKQPIAGEDRARIVAAELGDQVGNVDRAIEAAAKVGGGLRDGRRADVEAGAAARFDVSRRDEAVVGLDYGEARDTLLRRERANRWQPGAGAQQASVDLSAHAAHELLDERDRGIGLKAQVEHEWTGRKAGTVDELRWKVYLNPA